MGCLAENTCMQVILPLERSRCLGTVASATTTVGGTLQRGIDMSLLCCCGGTLHLYLFHAEVVETSCTYRGSEVSEAARRDD